MPTLPVVPNVIRVQWKFTSSADTDVLCRHYIQYTGTAPTNAEMATFAGVYDSAIGTNLASQYHSDVTLTEIICTDLSSTSGGTGTAATSHVGTLTGTELPAGTSMLFNFGIARRYRGGKPRMYLPLGSSSEMATTQTWVGGFLTSSLTAFNAVIAAAVAAPWSGASALQQVNVSYYSGFTVFTTPSGRAKNISKLRVGGPQVDPVTSVTNSARFASQRRRNRP